VFGDIPGSPKPDSLIPTIQQGMVWWEGTVRATGGATEPEKSFWYLIDFEWINGEWRYVRPKATDPPILVKNPYGKIVHMERKAPDEAERTLGVRQAPDGNRVSELQYLCSKAKAWAEKVRTKHIPPDLVWESLQTGIMRTLLWPMVSMCFTEAECNTIMQPIYDVGLSRSNVVRSLARVIVHGPKDLCGLGLANLYVESGILKIDRMCKYGNSDDFITGYLLRDSLEHLTVELGLSSNPLTKDFDIWGPLATNSWVKYVWQFLHKYNIEVIPTTPSLTGICDSDIILMERFFCSVLKRKKSYLI
jgi:hypothetical protein